MSSYILRPLFPRHATQFMMMQSWEWGWGLLSWVHEQSPIWRLRFPWIWKETSCKQHYCGSTPSDGKGWPEAPLFVEENNSLVWNYILQDAIRAYISGVSYILMNLIRSVYHIPDRATRKRSWVVSVCPTSVCWSQHYIHITFLVLGIRFWHIGVIKY